MDLVARIIVCHKENRQAVQKKNTRKIVGKILTFFLILLSISMIISNESFNKNFYEMKSSNC